MAIKFKAPISFNVLLNQKSTISKEQTNPSNKSSILLIENGAFDISISYQILSKQPPSFKFTSDSTNAFYPRYKEL